MPRYLVALCDTQTGEISHYITRIESPVEAICNHPWFTAIYRSEWVAANIFADEEETCASNIKDCLNWSVACVNLDEEIMNALNAGDSNVSSVETQLN